MTKSKYMPGSRVQKCAAVLGVLFFASLGLLLAQKDQQRQAGITNPTAASVHAKRMPRFSTVSGRKFFSDPDASEMWQLLASGRMFFNSYDQTTIIRYDGSKVERSEDSGGTFESIAAPFAEMNGARFYFVSADSQLLFAQSAKGALAYSRDSGDTWSTIAAPASREQDSQAPFSVLSYGETRLLWGGKDGLFVATMPEDESSVVQWSKSADLGHITTITTSPLNDAVAVGTADGRTQVNYDPETLDAASWISSHPRSAGVSALEFDAEDSEHLIAGYDASKSGPADGVVYYSQDGGRTWQVGDGSGYAALPDSPVLAALFLRTDDGPVLYVVTRAGVFVSSDFVSWSLEAGVPDHVNADAIALLRKKDTGVIVVQSSDEALAASLKATVKCTFDVSPTKKDIGAKGGTIDFKVNANSSTCAWSVTKPASSAPWKIAKGQSGRGDGESQIAVSENTTTKSRSMTITIATKRVTITQAAQTAACDPQIKESLTGTFPAGGQQILVHVTAASGCRWQFSSTPDYLGFQPNGGSGNATVVLTIPTNSGTAARQFEIKFGARTITLTQDGSGSGTDPGTKPGTSNPCTVSAAPTSFTGNGGKGTLKITKTSQCGTITLKSTAAWITLAQTQVTSTSDVSFTVAAGGTGSADITVTAASGSISGGPIHISQTQTTVPPAACTALRGTLSPDTLPATTGKSQLTISPTGNCTNVTATSDQTWLSVKLTGTAGEASAAANTSTAARTAKITLRSGNITASVSITQAGQTPTPTPTPTVCTLTLDKTSIQFGKTAGTMPIAIRATRTDCPWSAGAISTATTPANWIRVSPTSGTGGGTVNVSVDAASIQGRQATFSLAGSTVTVKQEAGITTPGGGGCQCVGPACGANMQMSVSPSSFPKTGGDGSISVYAPNTCQWTIDPPPQWIKYSNGNSGTGNGTIRFHVEANTSGMTRQVTIRSPQATPANNGSVAQVTISQAR